MWMTVWLLAYFTYQIMHHNSICISECRPEEQEVLQEMMTETRMTTDMIDDVKELTGMQT